MLPILIHIGSFTVYTYGVFVVLALFWFLYIAWKHIRITKHKEEEIFDKTLLASAVGLICGRLIYMLFHLDIVAKGGLITFITFHLYPGIHGFSVIVFMGLFLLIFLSKEKKYTGFEVLAYLTPALFVMLAVLSIGGLFAGTDVGTVTTFPLRIKYALYDGLRHAPGLYDGLVFVLSALVFHKFVLWSRQEKMSYGLIVSMFYWVLSLTHLITSQFRDFITYQLLPAYRAFDLYLSIFTLLTSLIFVVYYVRSYFGGVFSFIKGSRNRHPKHG